MTHKKYYYVLIALVVIMVFGTAAICNLCGAGAATTKKTGTGEETVAASTAKSADSTTVKDTKDSSTESTAKTSESTAADTTAAVTSAADGSVVPTISLEIYEGPTYSAGDDICFYRIKATLTGNPAPTVTFSKDDSGGAWGAKKVQINIHRGQSYNLTAIAKNSAGEASASKNLTWGCGEENRSPVINDITLSSASIKTGQAYDVTGVASDPDGDPLTYKWTISGGGAVNDTLSTMKWTTPAAAGSYTITLRNADFSKLKYEIQIIRDLYNEIWNKGNHPQQTILTEKEFDILAKGIKAVAIEDLIFIYEKENKPIGVSISLPDINEIIDTYDRNINMAGKNKYIPSKNFFGLKDLNRDLKIFNIINRRLRGKKFDGLRILILGIKEEYRKTGIDSQLYFETFKRATELGFKTGSGSQLADINFDILNPLFKIGKLSMTWRVYTLDI